MNPHACQFDSIDEMSFIITCSVFISQCILILIYLKSLRSRSQCQQPASPTQVFIKRIMLIWFIVTITKSLINITMYRTQMQKSSPIEAVLLATSAVSLFCDRMSSFTLHSIFLRIPCIWIRNTIGKLEDQNLSVSEHKRIHRIFRVLKVMDVYLKVRMIIILINLAFIIVMCFNKDIGQYANRLSFITIFEAMVSILIYSFGFFSLKRFKNKLNLPRKVNQRLLIDYCLLLLCCITRFSFNLFIFFYRFSSVTHLNENCLDTNQHPNYVQYTYMTVGYSLMHILPISSLLLIYWPEQGTEPSSADIFFQEKSCVQSSLDELSYQKFT